MTIGRFCWQIDVFMDKLRKLALEEAQRCTYDRVEYLGYRNGKYIFLAENNDSCTKELPCFITIDEKRNVKSEKTFLYANMLLE